MQRCHDVCNSIGMSMSGILADFCLHVVSLWQLTEHDVEAYMTDVNACMFCHLSTWQIMTLMTT